MCERLRLQLLLSIGVLLQMVCCVVENNELVGPPNVNCRAGAIEMRFQTTKIFSGKVYVRGSYHRPECKVDYSSSHSKETQAGEIRVVHGLCNMDRQRMLSPDGVMFSVVLVISFHPLFVTKFDKVYSIRCLYQEVTHTVATKLDVSMLPSEVMNNDAPVPSCSYTVRRDSLDGPILSYAKVGDQVVHRWNCDSDVYGMLVHSCAVEDGQGERRFLIDENGCHTDRRLLGDPTYAEALNMAYRESYVFKFADRSALRFKCGIRLCHKIDGGCEGITPPICSNESETIYRDSPLNLNVSQHRERRHRRTVPLHDKEVDLLSQRLYVLDNESEDPSQFDQLSELVTTPSRTFCLGPHSAAWASYIIAAGFIVSVTFAILQGQKTVVSILNSEPEKNLIQCVY